MRRVHGQGVFVLGEVGRDGCVAVDGDLVIGQGRCPICERPAILGSHTQSDFVTIVIGVLLRSLRDRAMCRVHGQCVFILREVGSNSGVAADGDLVVGKRWRPICERPASLGSHTQSDFIAIVIGGLLRSLRDRAMRRVHGQGVFVLREVGSNNGVAADGDLVVGKRWRPICERPASLGSHTQSDFITIVIGVLLRSLRDNAMCRVHGQGVFVLREVGSDGGIAVNGDFVIGQVGVQSANVQPFSACHVRVTSSP